MKFHWQFVGCFGLIWLQAAVVIAQPSPSSPAGETMTVPSHSVPERIESAPIVPVPSPQPTNLLPQQRPIVVVDPGHGGPDPGAVGIGGIYEKDIVLDISLQVASLLENQGIQAILIRQTDVDLGLQPRVDLANRARATLFVSIHANAISMSRPEVNGIETFHVAGSREGQRLAEHIQRQLLAGTGMRDRGVKRARFYVLVRTAMPAVLVEVGFVTGQEDAIRLSDPATRTQMARAIVQGILDYLANNQP
ncbi:N-acetylmuramoyl-L-alanine amidase family protein [Pantanalinema rosaneae CENA516]|uniref:N-acetylmuramoyl-L-alanine amidase family protein n=1 Tax=Pantanalinema rosaneae TaxID=1620701 RepID=UPI003D6FEAF0